MSTSNCLRRFTFRLSTSQCVIMLSCTSWLKSHASSRQRRGALFSCALRCIDRLRSHSRPFLMFSIHKGQCRLWPRQLEPALKTRTRLASGNLNRILIQPRRRTAVAISALRLFIRHTSLQTRSLSPWMITRPSKSKTNARVHSCSRLKI